jgi:hypothetical protein
MSRSNKTASRGYRTPLFFLLFVLSVIFSSDTGTFCPAAEGGYTTGFAPRMLNNLTFASLNCNSLNCSVASKANQQLKIHGITKLGSDIIFVSDLRLSNKNLVSCADEVTKHFICNMYDSYDFYYNSSRNKRGVGILINKKIIIDVTDQYKDEEENLLLIKAHYKGENLILGSIYGPNETCPLFFSNLTEKLRRWYEGGGPHCTRGRLELHS